MADSTSDLVELPNGGWDARIHVFRSRGDEVDTFAVVSERSVILIDTASLPEISAGIVELLRSTLTGRQLLVVNTHADYDHAWGNATFAPDGPFPSTIIGHELARERLLGEESRRKLAEKTAEDAAFASVRLVPPALTFAAGLSIHGGDLTLELLPTPGHTEDHISVWIPELRVLLAGDSAEHPFPVCARNDDLPLLRASLARQMALHPAQVLPCHGGTTEPALLERNLAYFDALERAARKAIDTGTLPPDWQTREDLPDALGFPFARALELAGPPATNAADFYRRFHRINLRTTVGWVLSAA